MVCGTFTITKVPDDKLQEAIDLFKANEPPPTTVTSSKDTNGTNTVTAVFPPCPDNTTHSSDGG